jgi:hypothetical protein
LVLASGDVVVELEATQPSSRLSHASFVVVFSGDPSQRN